MNYLSNLDLEEFDVILSLNIFENNIEIGSNLDNAGRIKMNETKFNNLVNVNVVNKF